MTHRPALYLALAFTGGILWQGIFPEWRGWALAPAAALLALSLIRRSMFVSAVVAAVFWLGAFAAWNSALLPFDHIGRALANWRGRDAAAVCQVSSVPELKTRGLASRQVFTCDLQRLNGKPCRGRVLVNLFGPADVPFGARIELSGRFAPPFDLPGGKVSYRQRLERQGIHAILHVRQKAPRRLLAAPDGTLLSVVTAVRLKFTGVFRRYLSPGEAGLMTAMLLGPRGDIPPHVYDIFRRTGTAHIIAISGMNMSLTAVGVVLLLGIMGIPRYPRAFLAAAILGGYSLMAGNGPPVARSAIMAAVVIISLVVERETEGLNTLGLAALVLLAVDPMQVYDVGFQLSFVCVAALILITPCLLAPFDELVGERRGWPGFLIASAAVTLAAFVGSAGILAYIFGYLSPVGLLVNLPVIPLMALVTALGFGLLATGLFLPLLAWPFALCLKVVLNVSVAMLALAARVPVLSFKDQSLWGAVIYYIALGVWLWGLGRWGMGREEKKGPGQGS